MKSTVEIDTGRPYELKEILEPSLDSDEKVSYRLNQETGKLVIQSETEGFGTLRGVTDNTFRLASLALKLY